MKHVNLSPELEQKKKEIMKQFREDESAADAREESAMASPSESGASDESSKSSKPDAEVIRQRVIEALRTIYDPEIPVNIYDLGLIYRVEIKDGFAEVDMTLTSPGCPVAQTFPGMVEGAVKLVPGISDAVVDLVWEPPWTQTLISEAARLELGLI